MTPSDKEAIIAILARELQFEEKCAAHYRKSHSSHAKGWANAAVATRRLIEVVRAIP